MKTFGDKRNFALEYEIINDSDESIFNLFIENNPICLFRRKNESFHL